MKNFEPEAISDKVAGMARRLNRLRDYTALTLDEYLQDEITQAAIERLLEQIIQSALDINRAFLKRIAGGQASVDGKTVTNSETFILVARHGLISEELGKALAKSGGFRNVLAHQYDEISPELVYTALQLAFQYYPRYTAAVQTYLDSLETENGEET